MMAQLLIDNRTNAFSYGSETSAYNASMDSNSSHSISVPPAVQTGQGSLEFVEQTQFICENVLMPLICPLGIIGNGLSLCVLTRREMAAATTCFLTAMAVSDLLLLVFQVPTFFGLNPDIAANSSFQRFIRIYSLIRYVMTNVFITCTGWLTVAVTTERFISLRFMFHTRLVCSISRARLAIILIFIFSFTFHFSKFFEYVPNTDLQTSRLLTETYLIHTPSYETYLHVTNIVLASIIPEFLLILANSFLIYFLTTHRRRMLRYRASSSSSMTAVDMFHVSAIVVATVLVFIACHSVSVFLALTIAIHGRLKVFKEHAYHALKFINTVLIMINSSVNFLLYCAISHKFRKTFITVFKGGLGFKDNWTSAIPLSENSMGNAGTTPRANNGKIYVPSSKPTATSGSHNGHITTKLDF